MNFELVTTLFDRGWPGSAPE